MLDARFSQLYYGPSLNTLQLELPAIAGLLVRIELFIISRYLLKLVLFSYVTALVLVIVSF